LLAVIGVLIAGCGESGATSTIAAAATAPAVHVDPGGPKMSASRPLAGKVVGIDPGHNGRNYTDPSYLNHLIWNGREEEGCDTTGTQTDAGYTEAQFNWNAARYLQSDLKAEGAKVVLTRHSD